MATRKHISKSTRLKVYEKYNGHCAYCGCELALKEMQVDHLLPIERFQKSYQKKGVDIDTILYYMPACKSCNHYKSDSTLDDFRKRLEKQVDVLMRDNATFRIAVRYGSVIPNPKPIIFYFEKIERNIK